MNSNLGVAVPNVVSSAVLGETEGAAPVNSFLNVAIAPYISSPAPVVVNVVSTVVVELSIFDVICAVARAPELPNITSPKEFEYDLPVETFVPLSAAK